MAMQPKIKPNTRDNIEPKPLTAKAAAKMYLRRDWKPIPVTRDKKPTGPDGGKEWQNLKVTLDNLDDIFGGAPNVAVQFGKCSNGLLDIDLDCAHAIALADYLLPETPAVFGRKSKQRSHRLYYSDLYKTEERAAIQFKDPTRQKDAMLVELRIGAQGKGAQSVFPPSRHPGGERIEWTGDGKAEPEQVTGTDLKTAAARLAAATLLVRHYPTDGARHDAAIVVGGLLARAEWIEVDIVLFMEVVAKTAGDEEWAERVKTAKGAVAHYAKGKNTPGMPRMVEVYGERVAETFGKWLDLKGAANKSVITDKDAQGKFLAELAKLDNIDYDRQREKAAKRLGIRTAVLDIEVKALREVISGNEKLEFMTPVEPWPKAIRGTDVLTDLCDTLEKYIVFSQQSCLTVALWIMHAHTHDACTISPLLLIGSPEPECGKTTLLDVISKLVPRPLLSVNITTAVLFRAVDKWYPTCCIDEGDTMGKDNDDLRQILNSGHRRNGAYTFRVDGDKHELRRFKTWGPKVVALIGTMHPTHESRSIRIDMKRRLKSEAVERLPKSDDAFKPLLRQLARWAEDNKETLRKAEPAIPDEFYNRVRDNWEPLLAVADACRGDWGKDAREAALKFVGTDREETDGTKLLTDLRTIFDGLPDDRNISSEWLVKKLGQMPDRPWAEFSRGETITTTGLSRLLKPFKIKSRQVRVGGKWFNGDTWLEGKDTPEERRMQGYAQKQFRFVFRRYLRDEGGA
jgi:Protein of unknown function (DUF3631)/Bifunctional DNA primase/polymerase, N-terminal